MESNLENIENKEELKDLIIELLRVIRHQNLVIERLKYEKE